MKNIENEYFKKLFCGYLLASLLQDKIIISWLRKNVLRNEKIREIDCSLIYLFKNLKNYKTYSILSPFYAFIEARRI